MLDNHNNSMIFWRSNCEADLHVVLEKRSRWGHWYWYCRIGKLHSESVVRIRAEINLVPIVNLNGIGLGTRADAAEVNSVSSSRN